MRNRQAKHKKKEFVDVEKVCVTNLRVKMGVKGKLCAALSLSALVQKTKSILTSSLQSVFGFPVTPPVMLLVSPHYDMNITENM